jgi:hypothetical protein
MHVGEEGKVGVGRGALRAGPGGFHGLPIVEVEFDDGVPAGVCTVGIGGDVILFVMTQAGESFGERGVDLLEVMAELFGSEIGAAVEDDHEFEHVSCRGAEFLSPLRGLIARCI